MAGFFLVFSGLRLLDVPGFARGYAKHDLLAMRVPPHGLLYPVFGTGLGFAYLWNASPVAVIAAVMLAM